MAKVNLLSTEGQSTNTYKSQLVHTSSFYSKSPTIQTIVNVLFFYRIAIDDQMNTHLRI